MLLGDRIVIVEPAPPHRWLAQEQADEEGPAAGKLEGLRPRADPRHRVALAVDPPPSVTSHMDAKEDGGLRRFTSMISIV